MKIILTATIIFFFTLRTIGQNSISNSKWKATLLIPHAVDVNFTFKKDTLYMTTETSGEVGTNFFIQRNDTLMIRPDYYQNSPKENPQGPGDSYDPDEPNTIKKVVRGGSFLCSDQYCIRYRAGSRGKGEIKSASNNLGFRCVKDGK